MSIRSSQRAGHVHLCFVAAYMVAGSVSPLTTSAADHRQLLQLTLMTGDRISGRLLSFSEDVVVLEHGGLPYAVAYTQLEGRSAYRTKLDLLSRRRGARNHLEAADHHELGLLALAHDRYEVARRELAKAAGLDAEYEADGERALRLYRQRRRDSLAQSAEETADNVGADPVESHAKAGGVRFPKVGSWNDSGPLDSGIRDRIIAGYKAVGEGLRERVGSDLVLVETSHFLIWTDWARAEHGDLGTWCEQMYAELARRFGVSDDQAFFPGKCPIFCLRSRKRFRKVARLLDDYDATGALGYTSSSDNGHVHVVACRQGGSPAGRSNFAGTLIHEGTHAFLHRYRTTRHIPAWINEGLADFVAEEVLDDRCPNAETAEATAREIIRGDYHIEGVFADDGMLEARHYPLAHSLVAFLIRRDEQAFVRLIDDLKLGVPLGPALKGRYDLTLPELEARWREAIRSAASER